VFTRKNIRWQAKGRLLALGLLVLPAAHAALPLHSDRASPFDLAVTGLLAGVPAGSVRYVRYADLRALPSTKLPVADEFARGEQEVTVVFLSDLWKAMPAMSDADCLLATCKDEYASVFTRNFIADCRPFLVLEIDGAPPDKWSGRGLKDDPGPYVISVSAALAPAVGHFLSIEHKKPWGVIAVEFARYADKFHDAYAGRWAGLSARAIAGREMWIGACASCHAGPGQTFSGAKSHLPFAIVAAVAKGDPELFRRYVRKPASVVSSATMQAHPYFTDEQLNAIIAFVTAEQR
jgi:mono/diheme cytochrome c family protein